MMKRLLFAAILLSLCMLCLGSCADDSEPCNHRDKDDDGICDNCYEEFFDFYEYVHTHGFGEWEHYTYDSHLTCEDRLIYRRCSLCDVLEWKTGGEESHDYELNVVAPSCDGMGYDEYICRHCYGYKRLNFIPSKHEFVTVTYEASCTEDGYDEHTCSLCGYVETDNYVYATDHRIGSEYFYDGESHWNSCANCDEAVNKASHSIDSYGFCYTCERPIVATSGIVYSLSDDGTYASVVGYEGYSSIVIIASEYESVPVKVIGAGAFAGTSVSGIAFPESLERIEEEAFLNCSYLQDVELPDSVEYIGKSAFYNCSSLTMVTLGSGINHIAKDAFLDCYSLSMNHYGNCMYLGTSENPYYALLDLSSDYYSYYTINDNTKVIGEYAFEDCDSLISINIPYGIRHINDFAFYSCTNIDSITIPDSVETVGNGAFAFCTSLMNVVVGNGVKYIGSTTFQGCSSLSFNDSGECSYLGNASNPYYALIYSNSSQYCSVNENTVLIASGAFATSAELLTITVPDSVKYIGDGAFMSCNSLLSVTLGSGIETVGEGAFAFCYNLVEVVNHSSLDIELGSENNGYVAYYALCVGTDSSILYTYNDCIFINVDNVDYLLKYVGDSYSVSVSSPNTDVGFVIYQYAFYNNDTVTDVYISENVDLIGDCAFTGCDILASITVSDLNTQYMSYEGNLYSKDGSLLIQYAIGKAELSFTVPETVTEIGNGAFAYCGTLCNVYLPTGLLRIGSEAFTGCSALASIDIPDLVTEIGAYAFEDCVSLSSVELGSSVETIGGGAFIRCAQITSIELPTSLMWIGESAFDGCSISSVHIPENVVGIGAYAFCCSGIYYISFEDYYSWFEVYDAESWLANRDGYYVDVSDPYNNASILSDYYNRYWYKS